MGRIEEIQRRRTFGIVSHPDAGKTTLTEKLLLFGGAIQTAGAVKSNKIKKSATSDFMEIEKQRGISVATSVMGFEYRDKKEGEISQLTKNHESFQKEIEKNKEDYEKIIETATEEIENFVEKANSENSI